MKRFFKLTILFLIMLLGLKLEVLAYDIKKDDKLYVSGMPIGIKLDTGVIVSGEYGINYKGTIYKPWEDSGIIEGDVITEYGNKEIKNIDNLAKAISYYKDSLVDVSYLRNSTYHKGKIKAFNNDGNYSLGLYVKDSVMGVGTLTYYVKEANIFGSLGHKITDYSLDSGEIYEATITNVVKPRNGKAGEKEATINSKSIGFIKKNSITGVHGVSDKMNVSNMRYLGFKTKNEINYGKAYILTSINGSEVKQFEIEITKLENQRNQDIKGITFKVTDEELIEKCGGIIQGMSGSPIIQDDKIIGAVTHVSLNDPKLAYGIYLEWMFLDMDIHVK